MEITKMETDPSSLPDKEEAIHLLEESQDGLTHEEFRDALGVPHDALKEVRDGIRHYLTFRDEASLDVSLAWAAQGHLRRILPLDECFNLYFHGAVSSGKTNATQIFTALAGGEWLTAGSQAAFIRTFDKAYNGIVGIDEIVANNRRFRYELEGILRTCNRWDATYPLMKPTKGGGFTFEELKVGGPKALNGPSQIDDALLSRCVPVLMPRVKNVDQSLDNLTKSNPFGGIVGAWRSYCARRVADWSKEEALARWEDSDFRVKVRKMDVALSRDYGIAAQLLLIGEIADLGIEDSIQKVINERREMEENLDLYREIVADLYRESHLDPHYDGRDWSISVSEALILINGKLDTAGQRRLSSTRFKSIRPELGFEDGINCKKDARSHGGKRMMIFDAKARETLGIERGDEKAEAPRTGEVSGYE